MNRKASWLHKDMNRLRRPSMMSFSFPASEGISVKVAFQYVKIIPRECTGLL